MSSRRSSHVRCGRDESSRLRIISSSNIPIYPERIWAWSASRKLRVARPDIVVHASSLTSIGREFGPIQQRVGQHADGGPKNIAEFPQYQLLRVPFCAQSTPTPARSGSVRLLQLVVSPRWHPFATLNFMSDPTKVSPASKILLAVLCVSSSRLLAKRQRSRPSPTSSSDALASSSLMASVQLQLLQVDSVLLPGKKWSVYVNKWRSGSPTPSLAPQSVQLHSRR